MGADPTPTSSLYALAASPEPHLISDTCGVDIYFRVQNFYRRSCTELQRLDAMSRSPLSRCPLRTLALTLPSHLPCALHHARYSHFGESLMGLTTIRCFDAVQSQLRINHARVNDSSRAIVAVTASNRWLGVSSCGRHVLLGLTSLRAALCRCAAACGVPWRFHHISCERFVLARKGLTPAGPGWPRLPVGHERHLQLWLQRTHSHRGTNSTLTNGSHEFPDLLLASGCRCAPHPISTVPLPSTPFTGSVGDRGRGQNDFS